MATATRSSARRGSDPHPVDAALGTHPDLAVVLIGANDVTHSVLPSASVRHLAEGVRRLREEGVAVVVGTCPDLGTIRPIPQPLKQVARTWSRRLAAAQTITVVENGGRSISLGDILGPEFDAAPALLRGAAEAKADILTAGAFGHPRLQEFIFGGTTRTLLNSEQPSLFLSH